MLLCHLWRGIKGYLPRHQWIIFSKRGRQSWFQQGIRTCFINIKTRVKPQLVLHLLLLMILLLYYLPPSLPPPISNSSFPFPLCQAPVCWSLHCTTVPLQSCTVRLNMFLFCVFYAFVVWEVLETYYSKVQYSWLCWIWAPETSFVWTYKIGLRNSLSEWNSFIYRGLTIRDTNTCIFVNQLRDSSETWVL